MNDRISYTTTSHKKQPLSLRSTRVMNGDQDPRLYKPPPKSAHEPAGWLREHDPRGVNFPNTLDHMIYAYYEYQVTKSYAMH